MDLAMNKKEFVKAIADRTAARKADIEQMLEAATEVIREQVANGGKVTIVNFGTFERSFHSARKGRNPKTNEAIDLAARHAPKFKASGHFKDMVASA
jgi:DNA-binding protein HU-beta